jgi:ankyrin repeat protein
MNEVLKCNNTTLLNQRHLIMDFQTEEMRIKELTPLMIACIMGNAETVHLVIEEARKRLTKTDFKLFVNVKIEREQGGNNALLYACQSSNDNYQLVSYLIKQADADVDAYNDSTRNALLTATKKS